MALAHVQKFQIMKIEMFSLMTEIKTGMASSR